MNSQQLIKMLRATHTCPKNASADEKHEHELWLWGMENVLLYNRRQLSQDKKNQLEELPYWNSMRKLYTLEWIDIQKCIKKTQEKYEPNLEQTIRNTLKGMSNEQLDCWGNFVDNALNAFKNLKK